MTTTITITVIVVIIVVIIVFIISITASTMIYIYIYICTYMVTLKDLTSVVLRTCGPFNACPKAVLHASS